MNLNIFPQGKEEADPWENQPVHRKPLHGSMGA